MRGRGKLWTTQGVAVGARERLPVERASVRGGGVRRELRGAAVAARARVPIDRGRLKGRPKWFGPRRIGVLL